MTHPADDFSLLLREAIAQYLALCADGSSRPPFAVVLDRDRNCSAFGLCNPPSTFAEAADSLKFTLCHGARSGAYVAGGYCGADLFHLPNDHRRHYALHVHLEHRLGDSADYALALDTAIPEPLCYEDWVRVDADRQIYDDLEGRGRSV